MNGLLNVLKPPGMTSHDVVYFIRKATSVKKIGHTGTLDPEAAGVLPICIGKATKTIQYITDKRKVYRANIKFGVETDTQDKYGKILNKTIVPNITINCMNDVIEKFIGKIHQTPPIYSAIKYKGKKLYEYAYEGQHPPIKSREIEIYDICIIDKLSEDEFMLDIVCSKGTYIRTLCNDIGKELGYGAHMSQLIRLESYPFKIDNAYTLEEIRLASKDKYLDDLLIGIDHVFNDYEKISVKNRVKSFAINGNPIFSSGIEENIQQFEIKTKLKLYIDDRFIGIGEIHYDESYKNKYIKIKTLFV